ncbi:MAG: GNAT family protein [Burkholderiales bacterium]
MNSLPLQTPSLRLRRLVLDDAARLMELNGERSTSRWLPSHVYDDVGAATSRVRDLISCYASPGDPRLGPYVLAVDHLVRGVLIGHVGFSPIDGEVEVSYAIAEDSRRQGYGAEALLRGCLWAAEAFRLTLIVAFTETENAPSRRTLERAAFVHASDTVMQFQGRRRAVSRYAWAPRGRSAQALDR